jgi:serine O-acetyltransferase
MSSLPALRDTDGGAPAAEAASSLAWRRLQMAAQQMAEDEPVLRLFLELTVLSHASLESALAQVLAHKLSCAHLPMPTLRTLFAEVLSESPSIVDAAWRDLRAAVDRDPATDDMTHPFLNHKGFHALQAHRIAHGLWCNGRKSLAVHLQSRMSEVLAVDIHPAARLGAGLFIDHATGVVIGETSVVDDDVSILQDVTLGGTGKDSGDRHPKIGRDVLLCAGAKVLGNISIGRGAKIGAGSVVLKDVPAHTTVVGVPARVVGRTRTISPSVQMENLLDSECQ